MTEKNRRPTPAQWLARVKDAARRPGVTPWFAGDTHPRRVGWYQRIFWDGVFRHWWNGKTWASAKGGIPHWRQVGEYPAWRGLLFRAGEHGRINKQELRNLSCPR